MKKFKLKKSTAILTLMVFVFSLCSMFGVVSFADGIDPNLVTAINNLGAGYSINTTTGVITVPDGELIYF